MQLAQQDTPDTNGNQQDVAAGPLGTAPERGHQRCMMRRIMGDNFPDKSSRSDRLKIDALLYPHIAVVDGSECSVLIIVPVQ